MHEDYHVNMETVLREILAIININFSLCLMRMHCIWFQYLDLILNSG
jgi:hypothetical protein